MIIECLKCHRRIPSDSPDAQISHTICNRCYILFAECNGGIEWKTATKSEREDLKSDIAPLLGRDKNFVGEPSVVWPKDGLQFVESIILELESEREAHDGKRR